MNNDRRIYVAIAAGCLVACGLLSLAGVASILWGTRRPVPATAQDLQATLSASTPFHSATTLPPQSTVIASGEPTGRIVFTCQVFRVQASNQICMVNADGTGFRRLTSDTSRQHHYPSLSPDGAYAIYSAFLESNVYEIYEQHLSDGETRRLTNHLGVLSAPEISPDGKSIVFTRWTPESNKHTLWLMDRDGRHPREFLNPDSGEAWDPTWSPLGDEILFASDRSGSVQLWIAPVSGGPPRKVSNLPAVRGRSDWSPLDQVVTYSGPAWGRELFMMGADGSGEHQVGAAGGNSQGPSFSPDGKWIAFTAYFDALGDIHGCEIYVVRVDGSDQRRITENDYCDYQPRWGP